MTILYCYDDHFDVNALKERLYQKWFNKFFGWTLAINNKKIDKRHLAVDFFKWRQDFIFEREILKLPGSRQKVNMVSTYLLKFDIYFFLYIWIKSAHQLFSQVNIKFQ